MALAGFSRFVLSEIYDITDQGRETIKVFGELKFVFIMTFMSAFWLALLSSLLDVLVLKRLIKYKSLGIVLITGFLTQSGMIILVVTFMLEFYLRVMSSVSVQPVASPEPLDVLLILVHLIAAVGLSKLLIEIDHKLGRGNLWKMLNGRFLRPHEEERIFMFIDMKDSTSIAEKMGHLEFSKLLQDCFQDFSVVDKYRAAIYQYVGDEVVISWSPKNGFKNDNFLKAYFAFTGLLKSKSSYYQERYGLVPQFKAGTNMGPIIITEVGEIKREITYHGDTINTAARIQDKCNEFDAQMLIPEVLYQSMKVTSGFNFQDVGCIRLKGKKQDVRLYRVSEL